MISSRLHRCLWLSAVLVPAAIHAQEISTITGTVRDESGAVVPKVQVDLSNPKRNLHYQAVTSNDGFYRIPDVQPGPGYVVTFTAPGFAPLTVTDMYLNVANVRTQDAVLRAGANTSVEVSAQNNGATLNTLDASVGNNLDVNIVNQLPVQSRGSLQALFYLQPGVASNGSVTGARIDQNTVTVDGLDYNDVAAGSVFGNVSGAPADSVQEFRGTVAGLPTNLGTGGGGQFQLVTKSGSNSFHGKLFEYHRDAAFAANTWFNNNAGVPRANIIQNQFGGNIGGPIVRDKTFFFFNYFSNHLRTPSSQTRTVPLNSFRNGTVSYIRRTDSVTGATCTAASRQDTTPGCIGTLSSAQIQALDPAGIGVNAAVLSALNNYPVANDLTLGDGINTGGYRFNFVSPDTLDNYILRIDHRLTSKMSIFGRATVQRRNAISTIQQFPGSPSSPYQDRSYSYVFGHIWQIGNNKVNQFTYGDVISKYNFQGIPSPAGTSVYTLGTLDSPYGSPSTQTRRVPVPEVRDDFNWTVGNHNINVGGTFKFIKTNSKLINDFNFVGIGIGGNTPNLDPSLRPADIRGGTTAPTTYDNAFALILGRVSAITSNYNFNNAGTQLPQGGGATRRYRFYQTELYAGDIWKATPNLTIDYGVRWQYYSVPYEANGAESIENVGFDQYFNARNAQSAAGRSGDSSLPFITYNLGGKANNAPGLYSPNYKNFAPRFGFSYSPSFDHTTVFRGSAAIVYDRTVINAVNFIQDQSSFLFANNATRNYGTSSDPRASLQNDPRTGSNLSFPAPPVAPAITKPYTPFVDQNGTPYGLSENQFITIVDKNLKDPYNIQYTFGMQHELPANFIFKADYVGRLGRRLLAAADASQLIDFPDSNSGQLLSQAFASISLEARNGQDITPQPWFENQIGNGYTAVLANALGTLVTRGDFADFTQALASNGLIASNVGMTSQFAGSTFETNKGFSSYNGLLFTLSKNSSHGIRGDFNYTWSHSVDNVSVPANYIPSNTGAGYLCDVNQPRICRASSDNDLRHIITADFVWDLPLGRGRAFGSHMPLALDEVIGGWQISGIPGWRSGYAFSPVGSAFVAGYANNAPVIFTGNSSYDYRARTRKTSGNQLNLFGDDAVTVQNEFTGPIGFRIGQRNLLRGPSAATLDAGLAKTFDLARDSAVNLQLRGDAFNVLNHPVFANPSSTDITSGTFGQITGYAANTQGSRLLQVSLALNF